MAADNKSLGKFNLDGIPPAPRGMPQVEVTFDIDANGILSVKAKDKTTGKEQSIRIEAASGLSDAEIEKMRTEADANATADAEKRAVVEAQNIADQTVYAAEKALREHGDKAGDAVKKDIQEKIDALKAARNGSDKDLISSATQALNQSMSAIGEAMQKSQEAAPKPENDSSSEGDSK
jgi:molecular chaperone DnaK